MIIFTHLSKRCLTRDIAEAALVFSVQRNAKFAKKDAVLHPRAIFFSPKSGHFWRSFCETIDAKIDLVFGRAKSRPRDRKSYHFDPRRPGKSSILARFG